MSNSAAPVAYIHSGIFWVLSSTAALTGALLSLLGLWEFWKVAFGKEAGSYPWGPVNENPWYYQTAAIYSIYCLVSGLLYLLATFLIIKAVVTKNKWRAALACVAVGGCLLVNLLNAAIQ